MHDMMTAYRSRKWLLFLHGVSPSPWDIENEERWTIQYLISYTTNTTLRWSGSSCTSRSMYSGVRWRHYKFLNLYQNQICQLSHIFFRMNWVIKIEDSTNQKKIKLKMKQKGEAFKYLKSIIDWLMQRSGKESLPAHVF